MIRHPVLGIIIVVKNDLENLQVTLKSIPVSTPGVAILVKDANSKDGTVDWLNSLTRNDLRVVRSNDAGIYDAMNQGVDGLSSEYYWFINAGEQLYSSVIPKILCFLKREKPLLVKALVRTENGQVRIERCSPIYFFRRMLNHQGLIYHKSTLANRFDPLFQIAGDLKHLVEHNLWKEVTYFDQISVQYLGGGVATRQRSILKNWMERSSVMRWKNVELPVRLIIFSGAIVGIMYWYFRAILGFNRR